MHGTPYCYQSLQFGVENSYFGTERIIPGQNQIFHNNIPAVGYCE